MGILDVKLKYALPILIGLPFFLFVCISNELMKYNINSLFQEETVNITKQYTNLRSLFVKPKCNRNTFALKGMIACRKLLSCREIKRIKRIHVIKDGSFKRIDIGVWQGELVVINRLANISQVVDFTYGLRMLQRLGNARYTNQLLGFCNSLNTYVTEYFKYGRASSIHGALQAAGVDSVAMRFSLCIDYVTIIRYLHDSPAGTRVMCDTNSIQKILTQYLVTDDLHLIVNDVDALPLVRHDGQIKYIKCGRRQIFGNFVAPEQLWTYEHDFDNDQMPGYDEQTDIWKIPDVCDWFLGDAGSTYSLKRQLSNVHKTCKLIQPRHRPSAVQVLEEYLNVWWSSGYEDRFPGRLKLS